MGTGSIFGPTTTTTSSALGFGTSGGLLGQTSSGVSKKLYMIQYSKLLSLFMVLVLKCFETFKSRMFETDRHSRNTSLGHRE